MDVTRESVYQALEQLLESLHGFQTVSRELLHWSDVPSDLQPAVYITVGGETHQYGGRGIPTVHVLHPRLYIYAHKESDPRLTSGSQLNNLLDLVESAMQPSGEEQTLGGLVSHCRIVGEVETDEGVLGDQAMAIIPIEILVP
jgi:hypothetical protein